MSNQGLEAHYPATGQSLFRRTEQIMRRLKENNTTVTGSEAAPLPSVPSSCSQGQIKYSLTVGLK